MFLSILKKTLAPFGLVLIIVIAFLLARGRFPFLRVVPLWVCLLVLIAVILVWLAVLLIKWIMEKRRAKAIEEGILDQAQMGIDQAPPAHRAKIEDLKRNLTEALAILKNGPQGKKALYSLPWYMIIGPAAIGKTTAVVNSGLNFPGMTTAKKMRGAGGTRNCDWWFSTDAVLLDTAGRYAERVDRSETETEWYAFLDLLKSHRKKGPIDGLILGYSIEDLLQKDEAGLIDSARELRQRMDEILDRLGWKFPVYVLFTKCDLISGFADYYSSLSPVERHQVWGAVYTPEPEGDQRAADRFASEFDLLLANLRNMRTRRMSAVSRSEDWGRVFMFPEELANLKEKMVLLIETLFEANPYRRDFPIFRGTYFSSGKQLGKPFDLVVRKIQSMLGAKAEVEEAREQEEKEDAYFVRDLFAKVLKIDRGLVRLTGKAVRRRSKVALFISAGFLALCVLACIWVGLSYGRLRAKTDRTESAAVEILEQEQSASKIEDLERLEKLRREITGSWRSFPLTVANEVHQAAQEVYLQAVTDRILGPLERRIAQDLEYPDDMNAGEVRRALRAELMLLMPEEKSDIGWEARDLAQGLCAFGLEGIEDSENARRQLDDMAEEFLELGQPLRERGQPLRDDRKHELSQGARRLAKTHTPDEFFKGIVFEASQTGDDRTLDALAPDQSILRSNRTIRAAFTRTGWEQSVLPQIRDVNGTVDADNKLIVLAGGDPTEVPPSREELLELYRHAYPEEWVDFLESVRLQSYRDCRELEDDLRKLRKVGTSPLLSLLRKAADISDLETEIPVSGVPGLENIEKINSAMQPLKALTKPADDQPAPLDDYAGHLNQVYGQVEACANEEDFEPERGIVRMAGRWVDDFVESFSGNQLGLASALDDLMSRPIDLADGVIGGTIDSIAKEKLRQEWTTAVSFFDDNLANTYPFADSDRRADPHDVIEFFGPDGAIDEFATFLDQSPVPAGGRARRALQSAHKFRQDLGMTNDAFQARFTLKAVQVRSTGTEKGDRNRDRIDTVILTINGTQLVDRIIQAEADFIWRTDDRDLDCSLVLKSSGEVIASSSYGGTIWSLCRLFEGTTIIGTDQGRLVTWTFPETDVKVEFLLTTHEEVEPFFIRGSAFRQFSLPAGVF